MHSRLLNILDFMNTFRSTVRIHLTSIDCMRIHRKGERTSQLKRKPLNEGPSVEIQLRAQHIMYCNSTSAFLYGRSRGMYRKIGDVYDIRYRMIYGSGSVRGALLKVLLKVSSKATLVFSCIVTGRSHTCQDVLTSDVHMRTWNEHLNVPHWSIAGKVSNVYTSIKIPQTC